MEASPSFTELLDSATLCIHMLLLVLASVGGVLGASKARKAGAPGAGPMLLVGGFGLMIVVGLWALVVGVWPSTIFEWSDFRRLLMLLGTLLELVATLALLAGFALLTAPPKAEGDAP